MCVFGTDTIFQGMERRIKETEKKKRENKAAQAMTEPSECEKKEENKITRSHSSIERVNVTRVTESKSMPSV